MKIGLSKSPADTKRIAANLAKFIILKKKNKPPVIGLVGELGSGKTTFARFFLKALGVREKVVSPTFVLMKTYGIKHKFYRRVHHFDLYRLAAPKEIIKLGLEYAVKDKEAVTVIEWAERIRRFLPEKTVWIKFGHGKNENERVIKAIDGLRT